MTIEIPGYKLIKTLGRGGMATVFLAEQKILERRVALKVMSRSLAQDPAFGKRFVREAKIVSQLVHPNIVNVHDVGNFKGLYYLSMQYVDGKDLKAVRSSMSIEQKLQAIRDIAKALHYAGSKGYVHRDIKPENILLDSNDKRAILTDFGIAKAVNNDIAMTQTGTAIGTPHYMSPEQAKGLEVDHRADIYSLGVVFYLLLTGGLPYDAESAVAIGIKHITEPVPLLPPALSQLQHVIDKMMAKRVVERYQSASDVVFALDEIDIEALVHTIELAKQMGQTFTELDYDSDTAVATSVETDVVDPEEPDTGLAFAKSDAQRAPEIAQSFTIVYSTDDVKEKDWRFLWLVIGIIALSITIGAVLKYYPHKVNAALVAIGAPAFLPTDHIRGLADQERKGTVFAQSSTPKASDKDSDDIQKIKQIITLAQNTYAQSHSALPELVLAYRQLIEVDPTNQEAKKALFDLLTQAQARAFTLAKKGEGEAALDLAAKISVLFPEIKKTQLQYIDSNINQLLFIKKELQRIAPLMRKKTLSDKAIKQILDAYNTIFSMDKKHSDAIASRIQFIKKVVKQGEKALTKKQPKTALNYSQYALQADNDSAMAIAFSKKVANALSGDDVIASLLTRAKTAVKNGHYYHPRAGSAFSYYSQVIYLQSNNRTAKKGLAVIYKEFKSLVNDLIKGNKYSLAKERIESAQKSASQSKDIAAFAKKMLPAIDKKIADNTPNIEKIAVSSLPISTLDQSYKSTLSATSKIYAMFAYSGLGQQSTQLDVRLFFSEKQILLETVPVQLDQKEGQIQFVIASPVGEFDAGVYRMVVSQRNTVISTMRFDIIKDPLL